ncbi:sensor histidine kinase [Actinomycetes bacterium M1A6_2h]
MGLTKDRWSALGRLLLVVALTAVSVQNCIVYAAVDVRPVAIAVVIACGTVMAVPRLPWFVGPVVVGVANAVVGWLFMPIFALCLFDLAVRRRAVLAVFGFGVVYAVSATPPTDAVVDSPLYGSVPVAASVTAAGMWIGHRRHKLESLRDEIEHLRHERELGEDRARATERARIATEMHDVLGHRLSLIALHAGVLESKAAALPDKVADRLHLLRTTSIDALTDLRDVLDVLHKTDSEGPYRPALVDVDALVQDARSTGQEVTLTVDGSADDVPMGHRLAVQRVVQEALTNVRKHSHDVPVDVRISYGPPCTSVDVDNEIGTAATYTRESGFGLVGVRERIESLGGTFDAGNRDGTRWRVHARIPVPTHTP